MRTMRKNKERVLGDFKDTSPRIPLKFNITKNPYQIKRIEFFTVPILGLIFSLILIPLNSLALMQSENYKIKYETISGGEGPEKSLNYQLSESIGEVGEDQQRSTNYIVGAGQAFGIMSNLPPAPTLVNDGSPAYYNRLHFTINPGNNPSDTLFAIAITGDNWTTTRYIQNDNSVGDNLGSEDWQTYANWGGASGELVIGLEPETTYKIKARARQGDFTMTGWGPESAGAVTVEPFLSFDILGGMASGTQPTAIDFGTLEPNAYHKLLGARTAYAGIKFTANPANNETVEVHSQTYTFKSNQAEADDQTYYVFIGNSPSDTAANLSWAINNTDGDDVKTNIDSGDTAQVWIVAVASGTTGNDYTISDGTGGDVTLTQDSTPGTFIDGQDGSNYKDANLGYGETDGTDMGNEAWGNHLRISTNATTGYIITVQDTGFTSGANEITDWSGQYGFGLWAKCRSPRYGECDSVSNEIIADDFDVDTDSTPGTFSSSVATLASYSGPSSGDNIAIEYNVRISVNQAAGLYADTITYIATSTY